MSIRMPTFQDIQTYPAKLVYVRMVYLGKESDLGGGHRIVVWQEELELEDTACCVFSRMSSNGHSRFIPS